MNMRKTGLLLTGGLAVMLVVFIVAYGILLATETMPVHLEVKEPITSLTAPLHPGSIALPSVVETADAKYLLTNIYTAPNAAPPVFNLVDTDADADAVSNAGITLGRHSGIEIEIMSVGSGPYISVDGGATTLATGETVPPAGLVLIESANVTFPAATGPNGGAGSVDPGPTTDDADNTARLYWYGLSIVNYGWTTARVNGVTVPSTGDGVSIAANTVVTFIGGTTTREGLSDGLDTCQACVIVGRTIAPSTPLSTDPDWADFAGRASEIRISGLLALTMPTINPTATAEGVIHVDTGAANADDEIARNLDGTPDTSAGALRVASIPLPSVSGDPDDGLVALSLGSGTRFPLPAYTATPAVREAQLVITIPDAGSPAQCSAISNTARWQQPALGTISTRNTYCGGVPLGGAVGQVLVKSSDDDCGVEWTTLLTVPGTGLDGQLLTWGSSGGEGAYGWAGP